MVGEWSLYLPGVVRFAGSSRHERPILVKKDGLKRISSSALKEHQTDWARVDALTVEDIAAAIRDDPDAAPELDEEWFAGATLVMPKPKGQISIRLDADVLEHFRKYPRYQTRINAILRAAMEHEKKKAG